MLLGSHWMQSGLCFTDLPAEKWKSTRGMALKLIFTEKGLVLGAPTPQVITL